MRLAERVGGTRIAETEIVKTDIRNSLVASGPGVVDTESAGADDEAHALQTPRPG